MTSARQSSPNGGRRIPLAQRLRPQTLGDVVGQRHLLGDGLPLRLAFESGQPQIGRAHV